MSRMNLSGYVGPVTIMFIVVSCLAVGLALVFGLGLDLVSGW